MSNYKVRSRDLVDIVNDIKSSSLILSPFFQRKLVWRLGHKIDFIKTLLLGFPFPEIFISRGTLDVETMRSTSCIVDGQQRMNAITEFIEGAYEVDGLSYADLSPKEKEKFLKYEIAIIDLDLSQDDPDIIEIFKRLNRTFYALSNIEKLSTEFGSSEFMLVAKLLCGELQGDSDMKHNVDRGLYRIDPNITEDFTEWANEQDISDYMKFVLESPIFTKYEISRQVHLMFTLNLMATSLFGLYARNEQVVPHLDEHADDFAKKDDVINGLRKAARSYNRLKFATTSPWHSKSNAFSLFAIIERRYDELSNVATKDMKNILVNFFRSMPEDYALAAREAVNNKKQRIFRDDCISDLLDEIT